MTRVRERGAADKGPASEVGGQSSGDGGLTRGLTRGWAEATAAGAATLADLRARVRGALPTVLEWPNATLDGWIGDGIRQYSALAPRSWRYTLALTTGTQVYELPGDKGILSLDSVEYPAGEDPPEFLNEAAEWSGAFQRGGDVYALRGIDDTVAIAEDDAIGQIVFGPTVATGQSAVITYGGLHPAPAAGDDDAVISVPQAHWNVILAYCVARGWDDLALREGLVMGADGKPLMEISKRALAAWERYDGIMATLRPALGGAGAVVVWGDVGL